MKLRITLAANLRGQMPNIMTIISLFCKFSKLILDNDKPARVGSMHAGENSKCKDVSSDLENISTSHKHVKREAEDVLSGHCTQPRAH